MKLDLSLTGRGDSGSPLLALVHGWGMHCDVFHDLIERLGPGYRLILIDLPGHGRNHHLTHIPPLDLLADLVAEAVSEYCGDQPLSCLGWSLGGQLAMVLALRHPQRVSRLVLVATTPRFVRSSTWPHGMREAVFDQFAADLASDHQATWQRFLALEVHGTATAREDLRRLRSAASAWPAPAPTALTGGLELLGGNDLRAQVTEITQPTLIITGGRDRLVPQAAGRWLAQQIPRAELELMPGCGHAPFIGDSASFADLVAAFTQAEQPGAVHV